MSVLIYTHPLLYQVINIQNVLKLKHIESTVRNEFASGATGDLSANDTWVELWLVDERDEAQAKELIKQFNEQSDEEWFCSTCGEKNGGSFEFCWQCQAERKN